MINFLKKVCALLLKKFFFKKLEKICDLVIRSLIKNELIDTDDLKIMKLKYDEKQGIFRPVEFHMTLFRVKNDQMLCVECDIDSLLKNFTEITIGDIEVGQIDLSTCGLFDKEGLYRPLQRIHFV